VDRSGADLALLLLGGFRTLVDAARAELAERGYPDVRPSHEFAMRAIDAGADNASDLGRRMSMTKQAAARIVELLLEDGYIARDADPRDARRKRLVVTPRGHAMMTEGERIFDGLRAAFEQRIGSDELAALERNLAELVGDGRIRLDEPGSAATAEPLPG
jgi:DNA-binding MarR family transcriptional regulator